MYNRDGILLVERVINGGRTSVGQAYQTAVGRYAEYYVKMEFTLHGFDVYSAAEVDDKGIDFVIPGGSQDGI